MDNNTWIRLYRKTIDSQVFKNEGLLKVWVWCLLKASYKKRWVTIKAGKSIIEVEIKPGQFIFGRKSAGKILDMSPSTIWKRMQKLKTMRNCDIDSNTNYSIVTVLNWDTYQPEKKDSNTDGDRQVTPKEHPSDTNKKDKKVKKTSCPDNFPVTDKMKDYAKKKNFNLDLEDLTEGFLLHHRSKGNKFVDWYSAWQKWLRNDMKFYPDKHKQESNQVTFIDVNNL